LIFVGRDPRARYARTGLLLLRRSAPDTIFQKLGAYEGGAYEGGDYEGGDYEGGAYEGGDYEGGDYEGRKDREGRKYYPSPSRPLRPS